MSTLTYGQCDGCDSADTRLTTQKIIGKWVGQKIDDCNEENKLITTKCKDELVINNDFTYSWTFTKSKSKIDGEWDVSSFALADKKGNERYFQYNYNKGTSPHTIEIKKLTTDTLILRSYSTFDPSLDILGLREVDILFSRFK